METLKRENKNLNDNIGNKLLLEEQVHDLKTRLEKKERSNDDHVALQTHIKALEAELLEYKSVASDHCPPKTAVSASNLRECIETILQKDVIRTSEKGTTKTENDSASTEMLDLKKVTAPKILSQNCEKCLNYRDNEFILFAAKFDAYYFVNK